MNNRYGLILLVACIAFGYWLSQPLLYQTPQFQMAPPLDVPRAVDNSERMYANVSDVPLHTPCTGNTCTAPHVLAAPLLAWRLVGHLGAPESRREAAMVALRRDLQTLRRTGDARSMRFDLQPIASVYFATGTREALELFWRWVLENVRSAGSGELEQEPALLVGALSGYAAAVELAEHPSVEQMAQKFPELATTANRARLKEDLAVLIAALHTAIQRAVRITRSQEFFLSYEGVPRYVCWGLLADVLASTAPSPCRTIRERLQGLQVPLLEAALSPETSVYDLEACAETIKICADPSWTKFRKDLLLRIRTELERWQICSSTKRRSDPLDTLSCPENIPDIVGISWFLMLQRSAAAAAGLL